jgi:putative molybdopterin biosynthesis protein
MIHIDIRPVWRFRSKVERDFDFMLIALLEAIEQTGKLTKSAEQAGISYRHAWNLIEQWQEFFGAPLVVMKKGRGTELTALGSELLWAGLRARDRLAPQLENLAAEFARDLNKTLSDSVAGITIQASHDFAMAKLRELTADAGLALDVQYRGSFDALAALRRGECDVAGFHFPEGPLGGLLARRYAECLPAGHCLVGFATRRQGFIVQAGNPKGIRGVRDLAREDVLMVNRQRGSGTRALFEFMLSRESIDRGHLRGYDTEEITHSAVAALVAGKLADVGFGVQAAAAQYRLDFVAYCTERYYLACSREFVQSAPMQSLIAALRSPAFHELIASLPGYAAAEAGRILDTAALIPSTETFP